ncbi:SDR family NAD(P)-dependent oxidoreductase [Streptomyces sp. NPDC090493]|uniref:SDR family NAD(P)-dependent oxidoreductase n=1 Tax=Streptomyces sp. NPDC090493 TaxID=3365964 RepID=UPI0037F55AA9
MTGRLAGRIAVVTGGSAGLGQEIARKLASEGADVAVADVNPAEETRALVEATGRRFHEAKVDVSEETQMNAFAEDVRVALGRVDIVVNNAGIAPLEDLENMTFEQFKHTFSVNVGGAFLTVRAFLDDLKASPAGRIVSISSGIYWTSPPPFVSYTASKGALNGLTHVLASNLGRYDITVNAVAPGLVPTATAVSSAPPSLFEGTVQMQELKRTQTADDVAGAVAFLASDDAAFITGQIIPVDGGLTRH